MRETGFYTNLGDTRYFIPYALPPKNPVLDLSGNITNLYEDAVFALGQLNETCKKLPDVNRFIKAYVIKEALLSSAIEGIHTTLIDVLAQPNMNVKLNKDTRLVINYTNALNLSLRMLSEKVPLSSRIFLAAHETLLSGGVGDNGFPGSYRKQTVRVGELIPPPPFRLSELMQELENYINLDFDLPSLIKAGLVHVQFETIHPFLDGNGRIGRLLIVLMLIEEGLLSSPVLYPSFYFKKNNLEYYRSLDRVRTDGDFEGWIRFYLQGIKESALDAYKRIEAIGATELECKDIIQRDPQFAKMRDTATSVLEYLFIHPISSITSISRALDKAYNTISNILQQFIERSWITERTMYKRNRLYYFDFYLSILEKEFK